VPDFGRVFLMLKYTDITQNTYSSWDTLYIHTICFVLHAIGICHDSSVFRKWEGVVGTGWSWLRIGTGGGHF